MEENVKISSDSKSGSKDAHPPSVPTQKKSSLLFPVILILLMGAAGGFLFFTPQGKHLLDQLFPEKEEKKEVKKTVSFYVPVPDLLVNLNTTAGKQNFLKLSVMIEVTQPQDVDAMKEILPRIVDQFQIYLRQLRVSDLKGSEGIFRLKEQLLARANAEASPIKIKDLLFKNMLVQ